MKIKIIYALALGTIFFQSCNKEDGIIVNPNSETEDVRELSKTKSEETPQVATSQSVRTIVNFLASDDLKGRFIGSSGYEAAATYIENELVRYGVAPYFQIYRDNFSIISDDLSFSVYDWDRESFNVVGVVRGTDPSLADEYVIIGAHLDTSYNGFSGSIVNGDDIMNGANDNASGVAAVLSIAKYIAEKKNNKRSVIFAFFGAEEVGIHGSEHLAEKFRTPPTSISSKLYTMINFDMIGTPLGGNQSYSAILTGYRRSNMPEKINEYSGKNILGSHFTNESDDFLFSRSDNYPFYNLMGIPSHTISSFVPGASGGYPYYHHVDDEASQLDYDFIAELINNLTPGIIEILNTTTREIQIRPGSQW